MGTVEEFPWRRKEKKVGVERASVKERRMRRIRRYVSSDEEGRKN